MHALFSYHDLGGRRCSSHEMRQVGHDLLAPAVVVFQLAWLGRHELLVQQLVSICLVGVVGCAHHNAVLVALVSQVNRFADLVSIRARNVKKTSVTKTWIL